MLTPSDEALKLARRLTLTPLGAKARDPGSAENTWLLGGVGCEMGMESERGDIKDQVQKAYSKVAEFPDASHPFRVGRTLAEKAGYESGVASMKPTICAEEGNADGRRRNPVATAQ
jgi:hypothetical protein